MFESIFELHSSKYVHILLVARSTSVSSEEQLLAHIFCNHETLKSMTTHHGGNTTQNTNQENVTQINAAHKSISNKDEGIATEIIKIDYDPSRRQHNATHKSTKSM